MRFGSDTPLLEAPALIAIAVAVVAFIAWLAAGTRDPDAFDVLKWIAAGVIGVVGIAYAGSWHEVVVDAAARERECAGRLHDHVHAARLGDLDRRRMKGNRAGRAARALRHLSVF